MALYIGLMSGTSLDAIDAVLIELSPAEEVKLLAHHTERFDPALQESLRTLIHTAHCHLSQLGQLDIKLGYAYAQTVQRLLAVANVSAAQIDGIGCHGQTIFHEPDSAYPFSMQIGNGNVIAETTGITTVCDFRQRDIVNGGQGAPLVPAFHAAMFAAKNKQRAIINIGGISNISVLAAGSATVVHGFDIGPGNILMDTWSQLHLQKDYDNEGLWAKSGQVNDALLLTLKSDPYFSRSIPKSTGRELFNQSWLQQQLRLAGATTLAAADIQATLLAFTASTIADAIHKYAHQVEEVYVCGGGARNTALMQALSAALKDKTVDTTAAIGLDPQWVEAMAFAWLAAQTLQHKKIDLQQITGARRPSILGAVYWSRKLS